MTTWGRLPGAALALAIRQVSRQQRHLVVVTESARQLQLLSDEIRFFLSDNNNDVCILPGWECLPYDHYSPHPEITSERLKTLTRLTSGQPFIVLLTLDQLIYRIPPTHYISGCSFDLSRGARINLTTFRDRLADSGYLSVSRVLTQGEFAVRGGLIDVFPMGHEWPFRLDLFGDELENIRYFDPLTQKSTQLTEKLSILPAREFPTDSTAIETFRANFRKQFSGDPQGSLIYREVSQGNFPAGIEFYLPLFFNSPGTFFDYLPAHTCFVAPSNLSALMAGEWATLDDRYSQAGIDPERRPMPPASIALTPDQAVEHLTAFRQIQFNASGDAGTAKPTPSVAKELPQYPVNHKAEQPFAGLIKRLTHPAAPRVLLNVETTGRAQTLAELLAHQQIATLEYPSWDSFLNSDFLATGITVSALDRGLCISDSGVEIIVESQLYGERVHQRRRQAQSVDAHKIIRSIAELHSGDPVVHRDHGVGRFRGLTHIGVADEEAEFLIVQYRDEGRLYVPVLNVGVLSRYIGGDAETAPLHRLGGEQWDKARERATKRARDAAAELLRTQALRQIREGEAFAVPDDDYTAFCSGFPYDETAGQETAIKEVLGDLAIPLPMDRLVCGDVGFGKTEVALRAAFVVVSNSRQVAILAPTTLLTKQHLESFQERFSGHAVRIACLSRFQSKAQNENTVEALRAGTVDIVVGTHRLLQGDLEFARLGLVIIDEEHRFGVRQKESLKKLRESVDVLTLTATPIPRTLNIALSGIRSISLIGSPPAGRVAIDTTVRPFSNSLIREACLREIHRGGQVYYLHNDVRSIERAADNLRELVPSAQVRVAHGQMRELDLDSVMRDFYHQRFNVLVCSTIIESGIDVPSANTIIINRADRFGLAQLHQLRGRVGRSRHQAYAFLLTPPEAVLGSAAQRRLAAIEQLTELGVGFELANHDLEIRGAGELLGEGQSGVIEEIGFSMYSEYLNRAIRDLSPGSSTAVPQTLLTNRPEINLSVAAFFPEAFLPDVHLRLMLYQRISTCDDHQSLHELQLEVIDRFGLIPAEGSMVFRLAALQLNGAALGIRVIQAGKSRGRIAFLQAASVDPKRIAHLLTREAGVFSMISPLELGFTVTLDRPEHRVVFCEWLTHTLDSAQPLKPLPLFE